MKQRIGRGESIQQIDVTGRKAAFAAATHVKECDYPRFGDDRGDEIVHGAEQVPVPGRSGHVVLIRADGVAQANTVPFSHASTTPDHGGGAEAVVGFFDDESVVFDERQQRVGEAERVAQFSTGLTAEPLQRSGFLHTTDALSQ